MLFSVASAKDPKSHRLVFELGSSFKDLINNRVLFRRLVDTDTQNWSPEYSYVGEIRADTVFEALEALEEFQKRYDEVTDLMIKDFVTETSRMERGSTDILMFVLGKRVGLGGKPDQYKMGFKSGLESALWILKPMTRSYAHFGEIGSSVAYMVREHLGAYKSHDKNVVKEFFHNFGSMFSRGLRLNVDEEITQQEREEILNLPAELCMPLDVVNGGVKRGYAFLTTETTLLTGDSNV